MKVYKIGDSLVYALNGIDVSIGIGEFVSIMGPSGSGKTTLLNMIGALDAPSSGAVFVGGEDVAKMKDNQRTDLRLRKLGYIFQFYNLVPVLTAFENVELPLVFAGVPRGLRREKAERFLSLVGLEKRRDHLPAELSGGEQQRVAIARALCNEPQLLIADEPTGELDTKMGIEIIQLLRDLNTELNQTILMVTHDPDVGNLADRILRMKDGRILGQGPDFKALRRQMTPRREMAPRPISHPVYGNVGAPGRFRAAHTQAPRMTNQEVIEEEIRRIDMLIASIHNTIQIMDIKCLNEEKMSLDEYFQRKTYLTEKLEKFKLDKKNLQNKLNYQ